MGHQEQGSGSSSQKLGAVLGPTHLGVITQRQFSLNLHLIPPLWTLLHSGFLEAKAAAFPPHTVLLLGQPQLQHGEGLHQGGAAGGLSSS